MRSCARERGGGDLKSNILNFKDQSILINERFILKSVNFLGPYFVKKASNDNGN